MLSLFSSYPQGKDTKKTPKLWCLCLQTLQQKVLLSFWFPSSPQNSAEKWNRTQGKGSAAPNSAGFEELGFCHWCWWNNCVWLLENLLHWKLFQCCCVPSLRNKSVPPPHSFFFSQSPSCWLMHWENLGWCTKAAKSSCLKEQQSVFHGLFVPVKGKVLWEAPAARTWRNHGHF